MENYVIYKEVLIKKLIEDGKVKILYAAYSSDFNDFISVQYVWLPTRIDWPASNIQYNVYTFNGDSEETIEQKINESIISEFNEFCVIYSASQPGIVVDLKCLVKYIHDYLPTIGFKRGIHFIVGIRRDKYGLPILEKSAFFEADHNCLISPKDHNK